MERGNAGRRVGGSEEYEKIDASQLRGENEKTALRMGGLKERELCVEKNKKT